jgi:cell wall-associated NlpC family hydrolase
LKQLKVKSGFRQWILAGLCGWSAILCQAAPADKAPDKLTDKSVEKAANSPDPVIKLLEQQGLTETANAVAIPPAPAEDTLVQQVRDKTSDLVLTAMNLIGVRYRRGGSSADQGFDCSGFTRRIFENSIGLVLPHRADEQAKAPGLIKVARDDLKPGDLVFFNTVRRTFSHVGIYIGEGKFIHAPRPGGEVRIEDINMAYWSRHFTGARRAPQVSASMVNPPDLSH